MPEPCGPRYAIYYTPAREHPLTVAASSWLGRDAFSADPIEDARPEADVRLTSEPRRYGFHATLKAPFRLREGTSVKDLEQALSRFAVTVPLSDRVFENRSSRRLLCARSRQSHPNLARFCGAVVEEFDRFRAPMDGDDLERRMSRQLDEVETTNLVTLGYPYVLGRFRFHMTLTERAPEDGRAAMRARLQGRFEPYLSEDYHIDTLSLFVQEHRSADFVVRSQFGAALKSAV
ncbi:DUF1045 domain-containing protein [Mesorhizobium sp.]|uniref:DUF1045 domain-containing protein n=1 Tax=Mesorhizobium sp. TaxID=1871066 RepID=UPI0025C0DE08|nr:DUF1045 domain-containing protein [Mesorhizobium sp.]